MKLKYYLRGLGIGIIITTIILSITFKTDTPQMSDQEIIAKAKQLGMVMKEEDTTIGNTQNRQNNEEDGQAVASTEESPDENAIQDTEAVDTETADTQEQEQEPQTENAQPQDVTSEDAEGDNAQSDDAQAENAAEQETVQDAAEGQLEETQQEPYTLVVRSGDVCRVICEKLQENGVIDDAEAFRRFLGKKGIASSISTGTYTIPYGLTYDEVYQIIRKGGQK